MRNLWSSVECERHSTPAATPPVSNIFISITRSISTRVQRSKHTRTPLGNPSNNLEEDGRRTNGEGCDKTRNIGWVHGEASRMHCIYTWKHPSCSDSVCCSWWPGKYSLTESMLVCSSPLLTKWCFKTAQSQCGQIRGYRICQQHTMLSIICTMSLLSGWRSSRKTLMYVLI